MHKPLSKKGYKIYVHQEGGEIPKSIKDKLGLKPNSYNKKVAQTNFDTDCAKYEVCTDTNETLDNISDDTKLFLSDLRLCKLPEDIGTLNFLTVLVANNNALTQLPSSINRLVNLKYLDVSDNRLTSLPAINSLNHLEYLNLSYNYLTDLPASVNSVKSLKRLDATDNYLTKVNINGLPSLLGLLLTANPITHLTLKDLQKLVLVHYGTDLTDVSFSGLESLENSNFSTNKTLKKLEISNSFLDELNVSGTQLASLSITDMSELRKINASNNFLITAPVLRNVPKLQVLNLANNNIETFPVLELLSIKCINLNNNKLKRFTIPAYAETVYLINNFLEHIEFKINGDNHMLQKLILKDNYLRELPDNIGKVITLHTLDVSDNKLKTLPDSMQDLSLLELNINNNPITVLSDELKEYLLSIKDFKYNQKGLFSLKTKISAKLSPKKRKRGE